MKIEVRCGSCGRGYLVDPAKVPPSGSVQACQTCGTAIELRPAGWPRGSAATPAAVSLPHPAPPAPAQPVVCPRCGLHFTPEHTPAPPAASRRPRVLLVEDMEFFQDIARQALEATADVLSVKSIAEARRELAEGRFDLLLLDLALEGEDGRDLLRSLPFKPCPILIFTARDESDMYGDAWRELKDYGADDVVVKGMQMGETLARKVAALLAPAV
ncbi:MAG TPA: response regulator [Candidatus Polarisedimenticolaceae bacterium]|nr:response regulator [Candidatus Polarisedimenticolaceae bacterium]